MTLGLASKLSAVKRPRTTGFYLWVQELEEDDRNALLAARTDPDISNADLHRILREAGRPVGKDTLREWRNGRDQ